MLTPDKISALDQVTGFKTPTAPVTPSQTRADEIRALGKANAPASAPIDAMTSDVQRVGGNILKNTYDTYAATPGKVGEDIKAGAADIQKGGAGNIIKGAAKAAVRTAGDVAGAIFAPVTSTVNEAIKDTGAQKGIDWLGQQIAEKSGITDVQAVQDYAAKHPNAAEDFGRILNITLAKGGKVNPERMATETKGAIKTGTDTVKQATNAAAELPAKAVAGATDLYTAITNKTPAQVDRFISEQYQKGVRPTVVGKSTGSQLDSAQGKQVQAVKTIVENKPNLKILDQYGEPTDGVPKTLNEFTQAITQTKQTIFDKYDALQRQAGEDGAKVDLAPVSKELQTIAEDSVTNDLHPEVAKYAETRMEALNTRGQYTTQEAQTAISVLNRSLEAFYKNPSYETASRAAVDALIANKMREGLDSVIEKTTGPGYQDLKNQYGALKSIEKDVVHRAIVDGRKNKVGLSESLLEAGSGVELIRSLATLNPVDFATSIGLHGIARYQKYLNNPNTAIKRLFKAAEKVNQRESPTGSPEENPEIRTTPPQPPGRTGDAIETPPQSQSKPQFPQISPSTDTTTRPNKSQETTSKQPPKGDEAASSDKTAYKPGSQRVAAAFDRSKGQQFLVEAHGQHFEIGDWAKNHFEKKASEGKGDRFPQSDVAGALVQSDKKIPASLDTSNYRSDNTVWLSRAGGDFRAVYTRVNSAGNPEVIGWHEIPAQNIDKYLEDISISERNRTSSLADRSGTLFPLSYGDIPTIEPIDKSVNASLTSPLTSGTLAGRVKQAFHAYLENTQPGLSMKDVTEGGTKYDVDLSSVKGSLTSASDHLVTEGEALYKKGEFEAAQAKYNEALKEGATILTDAFNNTGIKIKPRGVGLGIDGETITPNYDLSASVPKGKEDLFHYILADVADRNFHQYSTLTYKQAPIETSFGLSDTGKGISHEPQLRITVDTPLTASQISDVTSAAKQAGIRGLSVREGGKTIDIINLTSYNADYGKFIQQTADFNEHLQRYGIRGGLERRVAETRFAGIDPSQGHGTVSYDELRSAFRAENPGYFNADEGYTSKVIERIKNKQSVSAQELEQLTKQPDITPLERGVVLDALSDLKTQGSQRVPTSKFVETIKGKSLPITLQETNTYATYGLDNVGLKLKWNPENKADTGAATLVFSSPVEHGNQGHFGNPNHLGHTRIYIEDDAVSGKKVGYVTELQSDVFQKKSPEQLAGAILAHNPEIQEMRTNEREAITKKYQDEAEKYYAETGKERSTQLDQLYQERDAAYRAVDEKYLSKDYKEGQQFLHLAKNARYQDTLLRGTLQHFKEQGVETVRFVTPSSAAKIEGYVDDESTAPYTDTNGIYFTQDVQLTPGDEINYIGDDHTVVASDHYSLTVARSDKVRSFGFDDYVQDEVDNDWNERVVYDLKDRTVGKLDIKSEADLEKLTGKQARWLLDNQSDFDMGETYLQHRADGLSHEQAKDKIETQSRESADFQNLQDIYGKDSVYEHDGTIYVLEDGTETENLNQPSEYSMSFSSDNIDVIDPQPGKSTTEERKEITDNFDATQGTVLKGYIDLLENNLLKLAKQENIKIDYVTGNNDSTWYEFPLTKVKRNLFGN